MARKNDLVVDYGEALDVHPRNVEARERLEAVKKMQESGKA